MPSGTPTRAKHYIEWINTDGRVVETTDSSTRLSRALKHVEKLRNTRRDEGLTPRLAPSKRRS